MQRASAVTAAFLRRLFNPQPVSARGTLRIQTLHRPSRKLHFTPRETGGIVRRCFWCVKKKCTRLVVVCFQLEILRVSAAHGGGGNTGKTVYARVGRANPLNPYRRVEPEAALPA